MSADVVAVIPTFRPSESVRTLINELGHMVDAIVVADDASPCTYDPMLRELSAQNGIRVYRFSQNFGIARSLNEGLRAALELNASWLLTVDQDSSLLPGYVQQLTSAADTAAEQGLRVGVIGPSVIEDTSGPITYPTIAVNEWPTTAEIFQTGALWSVAALANVGGFDESFGMDGVDAEACLSLREAGYHVLLAPNVTLAHQWGKSRQFRLLGLTVAATGHSPARRTSMVRNRLRLTPREYRQSPLQSFRALRRLVINSILSVTVEEDRRAKLLASLRGFKLNVPARDDG